MAVEDEYAELVPKLETEIERLTRDLTKARVEINNHEKVLAAHVSELEAARAAMMDASNFISWLLEDAKKGAHTPLTETMARAMIAKLDAARGEGKT